MSTLPFSDQIAQDTSKEDLKDLIHIQSLALCSTEGARNLLPMEKALQLRVLPLMVVTVGHLKQTLRCVAESRDASQQEELIRTMRFIVGGEVHITWIEELVLEDSIIRAYLGSDELVRRGFDAAAKSKAAMKSVVTAPPLLENCESDVAKLLTTLLHFAAVRGASDLHLCPGQFGSIVKLRIDGMLLIQNGRPYSREIHDQIVARIKILSSLDPSKRQIPQDGSFRFSLPNHREVSARISSIPTLYGESCVIRFLIGRKPPTISDLGLALPTKDVFIRQLKRSSGLIILTGPTGSGKSTTLYAGIDEVRKMNRNVITVEDPIEQVLQGVSQVQVNTLQGITYESAIRAALRHDPDVLLIGEIRDNESAKGALAAASTGHLTLTSLHMASALDIMERLQVLNISAREIAPQLLMVINQRLISRLCLECKVVDLCASRMYRATVYQRVGCPACSHTGYNGRVLITESLCLDTPTSKDAFIKSTDRIDLLNNLPSHAWISWMESLQRQLVGGEISADQFGKFIEEEFG